MCNHFNMNPELTNTESEWTTGRTCFFPTQNKAIASLFWAVTARTEHRDHTKGSRKCALIQHSVSCGHQSFRTEPIAALQLSPAIEWNKGGPHHAAHTAQAGSPTPSCSDKMNKTELKNSEQRFPGDFFAALGLLLFLAVDFAAFGNVGIRTLCKSDIPSNRGKELSSMHAFQKC